MKIYIWRAIQLLTMRSRDPKASKLDKQLRAKNNFTETDDSLLKKLFIYFSLYFFPFNRTSLRATGKWLSTAIN